MSPTRLVLFDIDGTLLLSLGAGRRALMAALREELPDLEAATRAVRFDGKTDPQIVTELFRAAGTGDPGEERIALVLSRYLDCLPAELSRPGHRTELLPGVPELLDRVEAEADAVLGLLTGNIVAGARLKLRAGGLDPDRFQVGAFGSDHAVRAELPPIAVARAAARLGREPRGEEIVIIGDTPADVTCGAGVGARAIGVATGSYSVEELAAAGAYAAFESLADLAGVWEAIVE